MLLVGAFSDTTLTPFVAFLIPAGGFFTLLGLRGRAKAQETSTSERRRGPGTE